MDWKFREGDKVRICRRVTKLRSRLDNPGGWWVEPAIEGCRFWHEGEMTLIAPQETADDK